MNKYQNSSLLIKGKNTDTKMLSFKVFNVFFILFFFLRPITCLIFLVFILRFQYEKLSSHNTTVERGEGERDGESHPFWHGIWWWSLLCVIHSHIFTWNVQLGGIRRLGHLGVLLMLDLWSRFLLLRLLRGGCVGCSCGYKSLPACIACKKCSDLSHVIHKTSEYAPRAIHDTHNVV